MILKYSESLKAVDAAIYSRQWRKAVEILATQDSSSSLIYYKKIADHFASSGEYDVANLIKIKNLLQS